MKTKHILAAASLAVAMMLPSAANARNNPVDIYDLSLEQNLELPEVKSGKQADRVTAFQYNAAVAYKKKNLDVELMRDGEVIIITFQSTRLFAEGDTVLTSGKGGAFPSGLVIGSVAEVRSDAGGQETYGVIQPACDLANMVQVFIIKDYKIVE